LNYKSGECLNCLLAMPQLLVVPAQEPHLFPGSETLARPCPCNPVTCIERNMLLSPASPSGHGGPLLASQTCISASTSLVPPPIATDHDLILTPQLVSSLFPSSFHHRLVVAPFALLTAAAFKTLPAERPGALPRSSSGPPFASPCHRSLHTIRQLSVHLKFRLASLPWSLIPSCLSHPYEIALPFWKEIFFLFFLFFFLPRF